MIGVLKRTPLYEEHVALDVPTAGEARTLVERLGDSVRFS